MVVLVVEPGKVPVAKEISGSLKEMQEIVGGYIQAVFPFKEQVALVCNEKGFQLGLFPNRALRDEDGAPYDVICGTFFLCGAPADSESFSDLATEHVKKFRKLFHIPEIFVGMDGRIVCLPMEMG